MTNDSMSHSGDLRMGDSRLRINSLLAAHFGGWRWRFLGFGRFHQTYSPTRSLQGWFVPYWSIVIPLTLLSAWLLDGKPTGSTEFLYSASANRGSVVATSLAIVVIIKLQSGK